MNALIEKMQMELKKIKIKKNCKTSFEKIKELNGVTKCTIDSNTEKGVLKRTENKLIFEFNSTNDYSVQGEVIPVQLSNCQVVFFCQNSFFTTKKLNSDHQSFRYEICISELIEGSKSSFFRIVLPIHVEHFELTRYFDPLFNFCYDLSGSFCDFIKTFIDGREFHVYIVEDNANKFLFVDCMHEISYDAFYNQILCILLSLGFFSGYFIEDECYIFSSNTNVFDVVNYTEHRSLRDSIQLSHRLLPYNLYDFYSLDEVEQHQQELARVTQDVFTKMVNVLNNSVMFQKALFILLEAERTPLDIQPACLSVVLEALCNYVEDGNGDAFAPIQTKSNAKKLRKKMMELLDDPSLELDFSPDGRTIIEKRINDINKQTNRGKFEKAIQCLGLSLCDYEMESLLNRNSFLHASEELKTDKIDIQSNTMDFAKVYVESEILYRLLCKMILKVSGYCGYMVNELKTRCEIYSPSIREEVWLIKI